MYIECMSFLSTADRAILTAVSRLVYANPFLPERVDLERAILGRAFVKGGPVWSIQVNDPEAERANVWAIAARVEALVGKLHARIGSASPSDLSIYEDAVLHVLYQRYYLRLASAQGKWPFYKQFATDWSYYLGRLSCRGDAAHMFAIFHQIQRAFRHIFSNIIGNSMPSAGLRASVWQSIFTHDMRRYRRTLFSRMGDFATLITGPSGTGKELVASAIAHSRYVPFDPVRQSFAADESSFFHAINIAALSPTLIESELFGHMRGAFTGAMADRRGWLEECPALGSVFLDELGELDASIQVKLLRVIETRTFQPVGSTASRRFHGKLIAATNRDLAAEMRAGRFREDFYYRLCSDQNVTPPLRDQLNDLHDLILYMARRVAGEEGEPLAAEVEDYAANNLGKDYQWPGNYRELEQCVRNVLIRKSYRPVAPIEKTNLSADELITARCRAVFRETGSYAETARRLALNWRTVKTRVTC